MSKREPERNLGTASAALQAAGIKSPSTLRNYVRRGLIHAVRIGTGPFRYDLDDCRALRVEYPLTNVGQRITELVTAAPEFTPEQINQLRLVLHVGSPKAGAARE